MALPDWVKNYYGQQGKNWQDAGYQLTSDFSENPAYLDAYYRLAGNQSALGSSDRASLPRRLDDVIKKFQSTFSNYVGRDANEEELTQFINDQGANLIINSPLSRSENNEQAIRNNITQYVGDTFQKKAEEVAVGKAKEQEKQYAGLADSFMEMGNKSLGNLANELKSYQTSLFEKLRPQLNLAAQAGGYADSGAQTLQEQGALKDLANEASATLGNAKYDLETKANAIRYGGQAAPVSMASEFAANQPYVLANQAAGALNFGNEAFMRNLDYQHQLQLMNYQNILNQKNRPSFGGTLTQNFAGSMGQGLGNFFNPQTYYGAAEKGMKAGAV